MSSSSSISFDNALVFSYEARLEYSKILDKISNKSYPNDKDYLHALDALLNNPKSYDNKYSGNLKDSLETSSHFVKDDIYEVIFELVTQLKKLNHDLLSDVDFLENMGLWDFVTALWLFKTKLLPRASIFNWGSFEVYKDIEKKRHPFKGPGILYIIHEEKINKIDKSGNQVITDGCLRYYINGTITKRGERQEQLLFRNWVVPQDKLLMAIYKYMVSKDYPDAKLRDVISDLSELNAIVDFSGMNSYQDVVNLINV